MKPIEDPLVKKMFIRKDLSNNRINTYNTIFEGYCKLTGLSPSELIKEAKQEQIPFLNEKNQIIFPDVDERKVSSYLDQYYLSLKELNRNKSTIKHYMQGIRAFYREYNIELPKPIQIRVPRKVIKEGTIPNIEDIRKAIESLSNPRNKAIIMLMATSGIRTIDILNFKISDFTEATKEYHEGNSIHDLLELDEKYIGNIIPAWFFMPSKTEDEYGNICLTFNTPECTKYIIDYLKTREDLKETDPLFEAWGNTMHRATFSRIFKELNDNVFKKFDSSGRRFFRAHNLRKFFLSTYRQKTNDPFNLKLVAGHSLPGEHDENYQELPIHHSREIYMPVIPFLSIQDTKVHNIKSKEFLKVEQELAAKEDRMKRLEKTVEYLTNILPKDEFKKDLEEMKNKK